MVVVLTKFPVKPEHARAYAEHLKEAVSGFTIENQPGFRQMRLMMATNMPDNGEGKIFVIETVWEDMESFAAYTQSDAFKKSHEKTPPHDWFTGRPSVETYETIE
ncbi:antibiotic biosynthesis monooxygenase family protein [Hydrogenimonas sp.]|uniref:antibiotic biosynthesis monooxygenase family protein n=1 Tax=Hydrogenimonas sp. TaxID=2231112 RepID=UPI002624CFAF|nr:antibiotic biosynthesis monooxygenase family protein [Hydrogenimonas sp.]